MPTTAALNRLSLLYAGLSMVDVYAGFITFCLPRRHLVHASNLANRPTQGQGALELAVVYTSRCPHLALQLFASWEACTTALKAQSQRTSNSTPGESPEVIQSFQVPPSSSLSTCAWLLLRCCSLSCPSCPFLGRIVLVRGSPCTPPPRLAPCTALSLPATATGAANPANATDTTAAAVAAGSAGPWGGPSSPRPSPCRCCIRGGSSAIP